MSERTGELNCIKNLAERIEAALRVRAETLDDLCGSLDMNRPEILKHLNALKQDHVVQEIEFEGQCYYTLGW